MPWRAISKRLQFRSSKSSLRVTKVKLSRSILSYLRQASISIARLAKSWGLVDCVSFVVMRDFSLARSLTADKYFLSKQGSLICLVEVPL